MTLTGKLLSSFAKGHITEQQVAVSVLSTLNDGNIDSEMAKLPGSIVAVFEAWVRERRYIEDNEVMFVQSGGDGYLDARQYGLMSDWIHNVLWSKGS